MLPLKCACDASNANCFDRGEIVNAMIENEPAVAAVKNDSGQYPIFLAIQSRMEWKHGMKHLLTAYPDVMFEKDPYTGLYPFMMVASLAGDGGFKNHLDAINCLYEFTHRCPELIDSTRTRIREEHLSERSQSESSSSLFFFVTRT